MRQKALEKRLKGDPSAQGKVAKLGKGQYVQLEREGTDRIFAVIVEFGDKQYTGGAGSTAPPAPSQGRPKDGSTTDVTGPLHNQIPAPNRAVDNSTLWQADYNREHYEDMYFNRMAKYYETQSSGRYSVDGDVTEWVKVPFNEALYGRNYCGSIVCATSKALVRDALAVWVDAQLKSGKTMAEVTAYLKTFDIQDRYDIDGDGNFNEPDGVIDHFQIVHAGGDEAAGDPNQGTDAIWSHRWPTNLQAGGPSVSASTSAATAASSRAPTSPNNPTGVWVYDYTVQPENGGLGVFAHEFGHDLGLPDLYDTSGNTGGAENNTAFWTLMSLRRQHRRRRPRRHRRRPDRPRRLRALPARLAPAAGQAGPVLRRGVRRQALVAHARLQRAGDEEGAGPLHRAAGQAGAAQPRRALRGLEDVLEHPGRRHRDDDDPRGDAGSRSPPRSTTRSRRTGTTPTSRPTSVARGRRSRPTGRRRPTPTARTTARASPARRRASGSTSPARSRPARRRSASATGPTCAETQSGLRVDNIALDGTLIGTAETDEGWTFDGFVTTTGQELQAFFNAYIAENRQYDGYDTSLRTAYNFGFPTKPDWVETYPYQNGLLINYWDGSQTDNNVGDHPGKGLVLPVDAHPEFTHWSNGTLMRNRILSYDSTFGLESTDAITLHNPADGTAGTVASKPAQPVFDDTKTWWFSADEHGATGSHPGRYQPGWYGVDVPKTGTTIRVVSSSKQGNSLNVLVAPK